MGGEGESGEENVKNIAGLIGNWEYSQKILSKMYKNYSPWRLLAIDEGVQVLLKLSLRDLRTGLGIGGIFDSSVFLG